MSYIPVTSEAEVRINAKKGKGVDTVNFAVCKNFFYYLPSVPDEDVRLVSKAFITPSQNWLASFSEKYCFVIEFETYDPIHSYYGSANEAEHLNRRALEAKAVARWVHLRSQSQFAGAREIVALGDFNMPKPTSAGGEINYGALTNKGLILPPHSTAVGSAIASDNCYDQVAMLADTTQRWLVDVGVFDFDAVIFPDLWSGRGEKDFKAYLRYYISDHRPLWVKLSPRAQ
jgi:hypothetical protein